MNTITLEEAEKEDVDVYFVMEGNQPRRLIYDAHIGRYKFDACNVFYAFPMAERVKCIERAMLNANVYTATTENFSKLLCGSVSLNTVEEEAEFLA